MFVSTHEWLHAILRMSCIYLQRYFVLENSILTYAKNAADLSRGKKHGSMDIGMSVISTKAARRRIDIDADTSIVHLKVTLSYV